MSASLDALWNDKRHWSGIIYYCAKDPRVVVPGRGAALFTLNFAHPVAAWGHIIGTVGAVILSIIVPVQLGSSRGGMYATVFATLALVVAVHAWLSARDT
jgi:hypothetical protein